MTRIVSLTFNLKNIQTRLRKCTFGNISFRDRGEKKRERERLSKGANNKAPLSFSVSRVSLCDIWEIQMCKWSQANTKKSSRFLANESLKRIRKYCYLSALGSGNRQNF